MRTQTWRRADARRRTAEGFLRREFSSAADRVAFDGLDVSMTLAEIYEDVVFDAA
ncbi:hypothetical protein [Methylopila sp. Yamaguchi]|uniref:hypothetical protein n=1 Tax=Methylopila sp. Yamaguchi TaxID=1437817 RepID=UPI000CA911F0|nr:hypothetical protein [Methylopila sp. Yamaguchi]GBD50881.1 hypothetical protein METY_4094 [Methylopila sp. Yamaguchi]